MARDGLYQPALNLRPQAAAAVAASTWRHPMHTFEGDESWLLYRRATHPLKDLTGFMHLTAEADKTLGETARQQVKERTGLDCDFTHLGGGFFRTYKNGELEILYKQVTDSIHYAKRIQQSLLPSHKYIDRILSNKKIK